MKGQAITSVNVHVDRDVRITVTDTADNGGARVHFGPGGPTLFLDAAGLHNLHDALRTNVQRRLAEVEA